MSSTLKILQISIISFCVFVGCCAIPSTSEAGIFFNRKSNVSKYSQRRTVSRGHWSYPGSIEWHLQHDHGVNTSGMSHTQMLFLHDSLHEGRR